MAEKLLDEAGFKRGRDGKRFQLRVDFQPGFSALIVGTADYVKQALGRVGIDVELRSSDFGGFVNRVYKAYDYDLTVNFFFAMLDPTIGLQRLYWSKNIRPGVAFSNGSQYANPELDNVMELAQKEPSTGKRKELFNQFQRIVQQDVAMLNLVDMKYVTVFNKRIRNHTINGDGPYATFADVYIQK